MKHNHKVASLFSHEVKVDVEGESEAPSGTGTETPERQPSKDPSIGDGGGTGGTADPANGQDAGAPMGIVPDGAARGGMPWKAGEKPNPLGRQSTLQRVEVEGHGHVVRSMKELGRMKTTQLNDDNTGEKKEEPNIAK